MQEDDDTEGPLLDHYTLDSGVNTHIVVSESWPVAFHMWLIGCQVYVLDKKDAEPRRNTFASTGRPPGRIG